MPACNDPALEPGPLPELKADDFVEEPLEPFAVKRATEFAERTGPFLGVLDVAYAALEVEQGLDLFGDVVDAGGFAASLHAAVNPEALANLQAAEDAFRVARDKTASLEAQLPPDVQQPTGFYLLYFRVRDAADAPVVGALVELDADYGNGRTRSTDGNGVCGFAVGTDVTVAWTVTLAGAVRASGVMGVHDTVTWVLVALPASSAP